jgi:hypothetical protein
MKKFNKTVKEKFENFFDWVKGAELVELDTCDINEYAIMCFGFANQIPKTISEFDLMTRDAHLQSASWRSKNIGKIAIAYTVWSKKKGGGKLIVKEVFKKIKKSNHLNRLVTLSPLTEMARNFHLRNGAKELQVNEESQNFEYKI